MKIKPISLQYATFETRYSIKPRPDQSQSFQTALADAMKGLIMKWVISRDGAALRRFRSLWKDYKEALRAYEKARSAHMALFTVRLLSHIPTLIKTFRFFLNSELHLNCARFSFVKCAIPARHVPHRRQWTPPSPHCPR